MSFIDGGVDAAPASENINIDKHGFSILCLKLSKSYNGNLISAVYMVGASRKNRTTIN